MFRKIKKTAILLGCLCAALSLTKNPVSADTQSKLMGSISWEKKVAADVNDYLNIRKSADAGSKIVGVLLPGCTATAESTEGNWTKVKSGNISGYVLTKYLVSEDKARKLYNKTVGATGKVTASSLIIREEATTNSDRLTSVPRGTILSLKNLEDGWYKVSCDGQSGYVLGSYIKENAPKGAITTSAYDSMKEEKEETKKEAKEEQTSTSSKKKNGSYVINCSDSELDMLAAIVYCEAGGESYKGKLAVAAVVVNRVQSSRYPDNVEAVIKQKSQFSPVRSGRFAKTLKKGAPNSCYEAAIEALQGESPVGNAMSFRAGHSKKGIQIGNQYFF